ncbi:MAG TPA: sugar transferase [Longilinea sp.]|nr:sugar transferase [Longilinea sp.]
MSTKQNHQKPLWRMRATERRILLLIGDTLVTLLALLSALYFWAQGDAWLKFSWAFLNERVPTWFILLPIVWLILLIELYDIRRANNRGETLRGIALAAGVGMIIYLVFFFLAKDPLPRRGVAGFVLAAALLTLGWRLLYIRIFTAPQFMRRVLIVGAGRAGSSLVEHIRSIYPPPFFIVGFIDDDPSKIGVEVEEIKVLGGGTDLLEIIDREYISDLFFAISGEMNSTTFTALMEARERGIEVSTFSSIYEELLGRVPISLLESDWILRSFVDQAHSNVFYDMAKRLMDILGGIAGTLGMLIILPFVALATLIDSGFPLFYSQERLGIYGKSYKVYKFRTMIQDAEKESGARPASKNDDRVTRVGRFLRMSHLDELPQFLTVLTGDMSLVGPRSERPELIEKFQEVIPFYRARLFVKPGLTGWAQVNFGYAWNVTTNTIKQEYDLYYIKHRNLFLDLLIIIRTISTVVGLKGR